MKESGTYPIELPSNYCNVGEAPCFLPIDIGHEEYCAIISPDTAFWSLLKKEKVAEKVFDQAFIHEYRKKHALFHQEIETLRFHVKPSAVYLNVTERCNLNCTYCYIPQEMRSSGFSMSEELLFSTLTTLEHYFHRTIGNDRTPTIIFHGAEPFLQKELLYKAIERFHKKFRFGIQTNGTLLDPQAVDFIKEYGISLGLSLDGAHESIADQTRVTWDGSGVFSTVLRTFEMLKGYKEFSVICTITTKNLHHLIPLVELFHTYEVPTCMLNVLRCTQSESRALKPNDAELFMHYQQAIKRTHELFTATGRKLVVANFANTLLSIVAPTARRLMCDISPCGGGRAFFALGPHGDLFACSEFIGLEKFKAGNIFHDTIENLLQRPQITQITERTVDSITPCKSCAIRHFCGSPCPAEAIEVNKTVESRGSFCEFYIEQVRYALRLIADETFEDFLWDDWDTDTVLSFHAGDGE